MEVQPTMKLPLSSSSVCVSLSNRYRNITLGGVPYRLNSSQGISFALWRPNDSEIAECNVADGRSTVPRMSPDVLSKGSKGP